MCPYKLQMVQALCAGDRAKCVEFSNAILWDMKDDNYLPCLIFSDEATFHISAILSDNPETMFGTRNVYE